MAEYIERKKVYADISRLLIDGSMLSDYEDGRNEATSEAMDIIENAPSADVRPERHGRWSDKMVAVSQKNKVGYHEDDYEFGFQCSECGAVLNKTTYCGNCGAKMDEDNRLKWEG